MKFWKEFQVAMHDGSIYMENGPQPSRCYIDNFLSLKLNIQNHGTHSIYLSHGQFVDPLKKALDQEGNPKTFTSRKKRLIVYGKNLYYIYEHCDVENKSRL